MHSVQFFFLLYLLYGARQIGFLKFAGVPNIIALATGQSFVPIEPEGQGPIQTSPLRDWLAKAQKSGISELAGFVRGILLDFKAVEAAFSNKWSNGQTEGLVNRLKFIKRQMYGRANFDLLRARVIHQA